ncbi:MAG: hypothetical protein AB7H80_16050 [Candidatus Kapaibacterium sp.]
MNYSIKVLNDMLALIYLLEPHCKDQVTITALAQMVLERRAWHKAHALFIEIRKKTLCAERLGDTKLVSQYMFEEICAKTLYNLSYPIAPFDPDSPYWIIPNAIAFARCAGVPDEQVIQMIAL